MHGEAEVDEVSVLVDPHVLEVVHQRAAFVPRRVWALVDEVVAVQCRNRNEVRIARGHALREFDVVRFDFFKDLLVEVNQVHLVHCDHHVLNAEQRRDECMSFCLLNHAMSSVDQNDGEVARGGPGSHVPRVLFVARRVSDDELSFGRREIAIRDIDCDALLSFGLETVS